MNLGTLQHTIDSVTRQLQEARDYKASCEMKALLPPADCSDGPEAYTAEMQPHIEHAETVIRQFEASLGSLHEQMRVERAKPVQLSLLAF